MVVKDDLSCLKSCQSSTFTSFLWSSSALQLLWWPNGYKCLFGFLFVQQSEEWISQNSLGCVGLARMFNCCFCLASSWGCIDLWLRCGCSRRLDFYLYIVGNGWKAGLRWATLSTRQQRSLTLAGQLDFSQHTLGFPKVPVWKLLALLQPSAS